MINRRKKKYTPDWNAEAYRMALLGLTDEQLAGYFEINRATLHRYKKEFPSFAKAIEEGKTKADGKVAESLFKRAIGCTVSETKTKTVIDESGIEQIVEVVETVSEIPPDTRAAAQWLNNRQPSKWRNRVETPVEISIAPIPWSELREITRQAVEKAEAKHKEIVESRYERLGINKEYHSD